VDPLILVPSVHYNKAVQQKGESFTRTRRMFQHGLPSTRVSRRFLSGGRWFDLPPTRVSRSFLSGGRWFDRIIPEDDPETKLQKEKEREVVMKRLSRSIFAELKAAPTEKVVATAELLPRESSIRFPTCSQSLLKATTTPL